MKCADCNEPIYKTAAGKYDTERRTKDGSAPEGKERRAPLAKIEADKKDKTEHQETAPKREHLLHRRLWGGKKA